MKLSSRELTGIKSDFKDHALPTLVCQPKWHSTRELGAVQVPGDTRDGYRAGVSVTAMLLWSWCPASLFAASTYTAPISSKLYLPGKHPKARLRLRPQAKLNETHDTPFTQKHCLELIGAEIMLPQPTRVGRTDMLLSSELPSLIGWVCKTLPCFQIMASKMNESTKHRLLL